MEILRYIEAVVVIVGAIATFLGTVWTVSGKLAKHDEKQKARDETQDTWMVNHEANDDKNTKAIQAQIVQATIDIQAQISRIEMDVQRLKRRETEMSDQLNKVDTLQAEDRKRAHEDRVRMSDQITAVAGQMHEMDKKITQIHTIVTSDSKGSRRRN